MAQLTAMVDEELESRLAEASQELFNLRFQVVTGQLDNTARIGAVRRDIARVKTLLRARQLTRAAEAGTEPGWGGRTTDDEEER